MASERYEDCEKIRAAYADVVKSLMAVSHLLRTTQAGHGLWSARHKTAVSGLKATLTILSDAVPRYAGEGDSKKISEDELRARTGFDKLHDERLGERL